VLHRPASLGGSSSPIRFFQHIPVDNPTALMAPESEIRLPAGRIKVEGPIKKFLGAAVIFGQMVKSVPAHSLPKILVMFELLKAGSDKNWSQLYPKRYHDALRCRTPQVYI
jgi:hypothetical protein